MCLWDFSSWHFMLLFKCMGGCACVCSTHFNCIDNSGWCHLYLVGYHSTPVLPLSLTHPFPFSDLFSIMLCFVCNAIQTTNHMDRHIKRYDLNVSNAKKFNIKQIRCFHNICLTHCDDARRMAHAHKNSETTTDKTLAIWLSWWRTQRMTKTISKIEANKSGDEGWRVENTQCSLHEKWKNQAENDWIQVKCSLTFRFHYITCSHRELIMEWNHHHYSYNDHENKL